MSLLKYRDGNKTNIKVSGTVVQKYCCNKASVLSFNLVPTISMICHCC